MIELDIRYSGTSYDGKPCFIILHNKTLDMCVPGYKGGEVKTVDYSAVKHVYASGSSLTVKIMRTEVTLQGFDPEDADGLSQVIEIGRNQPVEGSQAFRKYRKANEKKQARADRIQARAEGYAAIVDGINRYREQSREQEREEQERLEKEKQMKQDRIHALEKEIEEQVVTTTDREEEILNKILKLNRLFHKCLSEPVYATLTDLAIRTCQDNVSVIQIKYPDTKVAAKAEEELQQFIIAKKKDNRSGCITAILLILGIIGFFLLCYFTDYIFPKK